MSTLFTRDLDSIPERKIYNQEIKEVEKAGLYRKGREISDTVMLVLRKRKDMADHITRFAALAQKSKTYSKPQYLEYETLAAEILPANFLRQSSLQAIENSPRYFQALMIRIERAHVSLQKDANKAAQLTPHMQKLASLPDDIANMPRECREAATLYKSMLEEFKVTVFAPEMGGTGTVSAKKLKQQWQTVQSICPISVHH